MSDEPPFGHPSLELVNGYVKKGHKLEERVVSTRTFMCDFNFQFLIASRVPERRLDMRTILMCVLVK